MSDHPIRVPSELRPGQAFPALRVLIYKSFIFNGLDKFGWDLTFWQKRAAVRGNLYHAPNPPRVWFLPHSIWFLIAVLFRSDRAKRGAMAK
jgi:hypothetical protein